MDDKVLDASRGLHGQILSFCRHVAGSAQITAVSLFDYCSDEPTRSRGAMEAIVVVRDFAPRILSSAKVISGRTVVVMAVDQWIFEKDVERGFLGEASAITLVFPHLCLVGEHFLKAQEVALKKRLILELLENLALNFPELSDRMRVKPEYFMYEVLLQRVRVFPPLADCVSGFMRTAERGGTLPMFEGYLEAIRQLEEEGKVKKSAEYVAVPKKTLSQREKSKIVLTNLSRNAPRTLFTPIFKVFPQILNIFSQNSEFVPRLHPFGQWRKNLEAGRLIVDPLKFVFVPTSKGLVSLADSLTIESYARKEILNGASGKVNVEPVGGMLNDVYLVRAGSADEEKRLIAKRFRDWSGFKWFPLNLWSLGTTSFAVLGKPRLE